MKTKKLFMPLALVCFVLFFASTVKAQEIGIKMNANPSSGMFDPGDQNWEIDFYNTTTMETYYVYASPGDFVNSDDDNSSTPSPLAYLPYGTYQITFYYQDQTNEGEYGTIDHWIALGDIGSNDYCGTSTSSGYNWPTTVTLDDTTEDPGTGSITIYTAKDY